jgi:hypothetical protein
MTRTAPASMVLERPHQLLWVRLQWRRSCSDRPKAKSNAAEVAPTNARARAFLSSVQTLISARARMQRHDIVRMRDELRGR